MINKESIFTASLTILSACGTNPICEVSDEPDSEIVDVTPTVCDDFDASAFYASATADSLGDEYLCRSIIEQQDRILCLLENLEFDEVADATAETIEGSSETYRVSDTLGNANGQQIICNETQSSTGHYNDYYCTLVDPLAENSIIEVFGFTFERGTEIQETELSIFMTQFRGAPVDIYVGSFEDRFGTEPSLYGYNTTALNTVECPTSMLQVHTAFVERFARFAEGVLEK